MASKTICITVKDRNGLAINHNSEMTLEHFIFILKNHPEHLVNIYQHISDEMDKFRFQGDGNKTSSELPPTCDPIIL